MKNNMQNEIKKLEKIKQENFIVFKVVAQYLNNFPCLVTSEIMEEIKGDSYISEEKYFALFLSLALSENDESGDFLNREYFSRSVKKLNPSDYTDNPYYKNIKIPAKNEGNWDLGSQIYKPYEGFVYDDIEVLNDYREIPKIGFFGEEFSFPTVFENGVEWMSIKPNEIETMKPHIEKMSGDVAVFGLGLGYFAYMISLKDSVKSITIVERDKNVISLFEKYILPQFENKQKIKIVKADAFDFLKNDIKNYRFDNAFVDLWHDVSDGLGLYLKVKKFEKNSGTKFHYWIEKSILSHMRWQIFEGLLTQIQNGKVSMTADEIKKHISDSSLKKLAEII